MSPIGDVANSKRPLLIIAKVQLRLRVPAHYCFLFFLPAEVGKSFFAGENLVTAQTHLHLYIREPRAFGISNICYSLLGSWIILAVLLVDECVTGPLNGLVLILIISS